MLILKKFCALMMHSFFMSAVFGLSLNVLAEELSAVDSEALQKTMELLKSRAQRQKMIDGNKEAQKADNMARELMGDGQELDSMYNVAAELFVVSPLITEETRRA